MIFQNCRVGLPIAPYDRMGQISFVFVQMMNLEIDCFELTSSKFHRMILKPILELTEDRRKMYSKFDVHDHHHFLAQDSLHTVVVELWVTLPRLFVHVVAFKVLTC